MKTRSITSDNDFLYCKKDWTLSLMKKIAVDFRKIY